jgi:uncharacterized membrane protein YfcA
VPDFGLSVEGILAVLAATIVGGIIRGFTGFGSALAMAPVVSLFVGPREAVPAIIIVMMISTAQLVPGSFRRVAWKKLWPLGLSSCVGVPLGVWALLIVDPDVMRRAIAAGVAVMSVIMLAGWRYERAPSQAVAISMGGFAGVLTGAASIGGPPVIAFLLAGPDDAATKRATLILFFVFSQVIAAALYVTNGVITTRVMWLTALMMPAQILGLWIGQKLFPLASEQSFQRIAVGVLLAIGLAMMVL